MLTTPLRTVRHRDTQTHLPDSPTFSRLGQIPRSFLGSPSETLAQGTLQYSHIRSYGSDSIPRGYLSPPSPNYITSALATLNFCPDTDDFFTISKEVWTSSSRLVVSQFIADHFSLLLELVRYQQSHSRAFGQSRLTLRAIRAIPTSARKSSLWMY